MAYSNYKKNSELNKTDQTLLEKKRSNNIIKKKITHNYYEIIFKNKFDVKKNSERNYTFNLT